MDVLVFGGTVIDDVGKVKSFSENAVQLNAFKEMVGGMGYNTAYALSTLGLDTGLVSSIGDDFKSIEQPQNLKFFFHKSTTDLCARSLLFYDDKGNEQIFFYPGCYNRLGDWEKLKKLIKKAEHVHFAGVIPGFSELSLVAKDEKKTVSFNPGYDIFHYSRNDRVLKQTIRNTDYLILNKEELAYLGGRPDKLSENLSSLVVTIGKHGAILYIKGVEKTIKSYSVKSMSPFGAGDTFTAAFIASVLREDDMVDAVKYANSAGSYAIESLRPQVSLDWDKLEERKKKI